MKINYLRKYGILLLVAISCINMGVDQTSTAPKAFHTELDRNEASYEAYIYENGKSRKIKDINFSGKTTINKIRREGEKGFKDIDLAFVGEINIVKASHFTDDGAEYTLVDYISKSGETIDRLLFPKNLVISGVGVEPGEAGINVYWQMHALKKIVIEHGLPKTSPEPVAIDAE